MQASTQTVGLLSGRQEKPQPFNIYTCSLLFFFELLNYDVGGSYYTLNDGVISD